MLALLLLVAGQDRLCLVRLYSDMMQGAEGSVAGVQPKAMRNPNAILDSGHDPARRSTQRT